MRIRRNGILLRKSAGRETDITDVTGKGGHAMTKPYMPEYPRLCAPLSVGNVTLRNRMCSAPMGFPDLTEDGCLTEGAIAFYENRARGGAAIVTISEACVA